ncbi:MAG: acyl-CoA thioesterase II [Pseudomonadales bacterium]|jgi:acyl-CoA thioesterase II|nr:acyl-CoA thioesterase II [Pseudomonadales bacterium]
MSDSANHRSERLLEILDLQQIEQNLYLGQNETAQGKRLFGGQVLAQALTAAYRTVDGLHCHSLHAYFIRAGNAARPVLYEVERIRDGRSFTTRRVVAIQNGEAIFSMDVSFQVDELGFRHAHPMPNVPLPHELRDDVAVAAEIDANDPRMGAMVKIERPFETRSVFPLGSDEWAQNRFFSPTWIRFRDAPAVEDQSLSRCLLAYASDMSLVSTASLPHQSDITRDKLQMASLDHALWIHRSVPINQWLLFHKRTSTAQASRGMVHADFYAESGTLIASVTQEGLVRIRRA